MEQKYIFRSHYNNNGDYDGFVVEDKTILTRKDLEFITEVSEKFYNNMELEMTQIHNLSVGAVQIKGRINPYIERRKETFGIFVQKSQEPPKEPVNKAEVVRRLYLKCFAELEEIVKPEEKKRGTVFCTIYGDFRDRLNDSGIKIDPAVMLTHMLETFADCNNMHDRQGIDLLLPYIKHELTR